MEDLRPLFDRLERIEGSLNNISTAIGILIGSFAAFVLLSASGVIS